MAGHELIAAERRRQILQEGWSADHDDAHASGELVLAAECYIRFGAALRTYPVGHPPIDWPWEDHWWKPDDDYTRTLVKAGALIAAEIDRRARAAA